MVKEGGPIGIEATEQTQQAAALSQSPSNQMRPFAIDSLGSEAPSLESARVSWDAHISTALPFLLLGPLSRIGYFELYSAVLQAAKLENLFCFCGCLAYKSLHGRSAAGGERAKPELAATVFAGTDRQITDESIEEFSRNISKHIGPIERQTHRKSNRRPLDGSPAVLLRVESLSLKDSCL